MATVNFSGTWKEGESVNKTEFCAACGLDAAMSKHFGEMKGTVIIVHDGDSFHTKETGPDGTVILDDKMTVGVPYTANVPDGVPEMEVLCSWEDGGKTLKSVATDPAMKMENMYKINDNGEMTVVSTKDDVVCTIQYTKA